MNKHTPGPWKMERDGNFPYIVADQGKTWNNPTICTLYEDVTPEDSVTVGAWLKAYDNAEANARLIAAAPDMLEALEFVSEAYQRMFDVMPVAFQTAINIVETAIAKARGE